MAAKAKQALVGRVIKAKKRGKAKKHPNKHQSIKAYRGQGR
jgi:hypothetical protein